VAAGERSDVEAGATLLKALASPQRLAILLELEHGARCVHELVEALGASQPLVSQHLRTLREARVIAGTRRGREIEYRLADDHVLHVVRDAIAHALEHEG
jgi:DNA-binding transcriptional ArsR family regulator